MEIDGTITSIIFRNAANGWTVLELSGDGGEKTSAVGVLPLCSVGERVSLTGAFVSHPKYGRQFKAEACRTLAPATLSAVEGWLGSGLVRGVGRHTARDIVQFFGMDTLTVLDETPERLLEVPGIGKKRLGTIVDSYRQNRTMRDIMLALEPYGVTVNQALKLYGIYGDTCMARIEENPYQIIADVDGVGFVTADRIAQNVAGFSFDSDSRLRAGLTYALTQAAGENGHTFLPHDKLLQVASALLGVPAEPLSDALDGLIEAGAVVSRAVGTQQGVFLPYMLNVENGIAEKLIRLSEKPIDNPFFDFEAVRAMQSLTLSNQQQDAVRAALNEGVLVITGGPGTGKTTIIRFITAIMAEMGLDVALTAPTGRAAKRMTEATGQDARTLHRLLEYVPGEGFQRNRDNPLYYDMIIVDEASMVDVILLNALLNAVPQGTRLIMVGDADQLPPVGPGDALRDIIDSQTVRVARLTEIYRQAQRSMIVTNAHRINEGVEPLLSAPQSDFRFEQIPNQEGILQRILSLCACPGDELPTGEPLMDIQVLAPMKKGLLGVHNLNNALQAALNPPSDGKAEHISGETLFREGDRIMQIKNNYRVEWTRGGGAYAEQGMGAFNGDLGTVFSIDARARRMRVLYDDDRLAAFDFAQLDELDLAYCISIHKSQGSEFPVVILPMFGGMSPMLTRNLLYTAVTRARRQVVCIGRREAMLAMVNNNRTNRRYTALETLLAEWRQLI